MTARTCPSERRQRSRAASHRSTIVMSDTMTSSGRGPDCMQSLLSSSTVCASPSRRSACPNHRDDSNPPLSAQSGRSRQPRARTNMPHQICSTRAADPSCVQTPEDRLSPTSSRLPSDRDKITPLLARPRGAARCPGHEEHRAMAEVGERAADRAYRLVRHDIITGELGAGRRLGEIELADRYGLSRTPIRETLRRLESEGLVEVLPHRGARVVDWSEVDVSAIYDLRAMVEGFAARRAATRIELDEIDRLGTLCDEMERITEAYKPGDPEQADRIAQLNSDLHGSIADAAGQYHIRAMRNIVVVVPLVLRMIHVFGVQDQVRSNGHHRELLEALRARDGDWAESVMSSHVHAAKQRLLRPDPSIPPLDGPAQ
ncbi:FCD domain-containing protein [Nocardioides sp. zg-578]|nr:FCD domain-containing protein [Nocardioides marmotae]